MFPLQSLPLIYFTLTQHLSCSQVSQSFFFFAKAFRSPKHFPHFRENCALRGNFPLMEKWVFHILQFSNLAKESLEATSSGPKLMQIHFFPSNIRSCFFTLEVKSWEQENFLGCVKDKKKKKREKSKNQEIFTKKKSGKIRMWKALKKIQSLWLFDIKIVILRRASQLHHIKISLLPADQTRHWQWIFCIKILLDFWVFEFDQKKKTMGTEGNGTAESKYSVFKIIFCMNLMFDWKRNFWFFKKKQERFKNFLIVTI